MPSAQDNFYVTVAYSGSLQCKLFDIRVASYEAKQRTKIKPVLSGSSCELQSLLDKLKLSSFLILKAVQQFPPKTFRSWFCSVRKKKLSHKTWMPQLLGSLSGSWMSNILLCKVPGIYLIMVIFCFLLFFFLWKNICRRKKGGRKYVPFQPQQTNRMCLSSALAVGLTVPAVDRLWQDKGEKMQFVRTLGKWACLNVTIFLMVIITPCIAHLE